MNIVLYLLIAHTILWAIMASLAGFFESKHWSSLNIGTKIFTYFSAEIQLYNVIVKLVRNRRVIAEIWKGKRRSL